MREDWLVLTQLKVVTGLELSKRRRSGQARQSRSNDSSTQSTLLYSTELRVPPNTQARLGAALVEWTLLAILCFLMSARVVLGGERRPGAPSHSCNLLLED